MKQFLDHRSNRWTHDGWALMVRGASQPMLWTACTTREEARELRRERFNMKDFFIGPVDVVKIKITAEVIGG